MSRVVLLSGAALSGVACAADRALDAPTSPYPLYSAVLNAMRADTAWFGPVLVDPRTYSLAGRDSITAGWRGSDDMIVSDQSAAAFLEANQHRVILGDSFDTAPPVELLTPSQQELFDLGGALWRSIRETHGESVVIVRFSRPGIDSRSGEALLYYTFFCGPSTCGEGHHVRLQESDGGWALTGDVLAWIS